MRLVTQRKAQLRELGKSGSHVKLLALLMELRFNPIDEFEKQFAEAYLMKLANLVLPEDKGSAVPEEIDPFA
jgi:hypothetical protein